MEFVVGASEATMQSLLGKLGGLLAQEYTLIRGVRGDIQYINDELATMQAFLGDLSSTNDDHDRRLKNWTKQIRDMAYDMEDCIDDFAHRLPHNSLSDARCSFILTLFYDLWTFWPRREIASKIAELKVRAQQIAERRSRYGVDNPSSKSGINSVRADDGTDFIPRRQLILMQDPVGVEEHMKKLGPLLERESHVAVISIVGFGGVGKTTIATALYRDSSNQFDCQASVMVSQNDEDQVLRDILGQIKPRDREQEQQAHNIGTSAEKNLDASIKPGLAKRLVPLFRGHSKQGNDGGTQRTPGKIENMTRYQLTNELRSRLLGKRYILLIDDIWSVETWENIRSWLPDIEGMRSKVIVTTRFPAVGEACTGREGSAYHTINVLGSFESKPLFYRAVFESRSTLVWSEPSTTSQAIVTECSKGDGTDNLHSPYISDADANDQQTDRVSDPQSSNGNKKGKVLEEGWEYCGGLPLAIVTMAGLVACNDQSKTNEHYSKLKKLFPEHVTRLTLDDVTKILEYCFNDLPSDLKTCSLYLSIFPKGSKISKKRLTRRWISESFVAEKQGKSAEEVAERYFNQLIRRKIIRPVDHSSHGNIKSFKVHDMILEYIMSKSSEENFITVVGGHWMMPTRSNKVRRLSMQSSGSKDGNSTKGMDLSHVRSVTVFGSQNRRLPFHSFNNGIIQVLDLEGWKGMTDNYLNDICKMLVLKYLSLRRTEVVNIPSKIGKLEYLETLDIRETRVEVLPKAFGQLKRLRSMLGGSKNPRKALKLQLEKNKEPMKALRILSGIEINKDSTAVASLHQMTGLKKLAIYKLNIQEGDKIFKQLLFSIEYLSSCGLQTLAINDEGSDFINSLDSMSTPPRYLIGLELSGKMESPPKWIKDLSNLYKLTLSVTVLRTDTFQLIKYLPKLFSLTFTLTADKDDRDIVDILEENKLLTDREIIVPPGGFKNLKLIRFFATLVPRLSFAVTEEEVMPALERIDMRFQAFEGIYGIEALNSLQELHLSVGNQADEVTKFLVEELKDRPTYLDKAYASKWPKIISD